MFCTRIAGYVFRSSRPFPVGIMEPVSFGVAKERKTVRREWRGRASQFSDYTRVIEDCVPHEIWQKHLQQRSRVAKIIVSAREPRGLPAVWPGHLPSQSAGRPGSTAKQTNRPSGSRLPNQAQQSARSSKPHSECVCCDSSTMPYPYAKTRALD